MHTHLSAFGGTALLFAAMLTSAHAQNTSTLPPNVPPPGVNAGAPPRGVSVVLRRRRVSIIDGIANSQGAIRHPANAGSPTRAQSL
jgi:hypothetical protein